MMRAPDDFNDPNDPQQGGVRGQLRQRLGPSAGFPTSGPVFDAAQRGTVGPQEAFPQPMRSLPGQSGPYQASPAPSPRSLPGQSGPYQASPMASPRSLPGQPGPYQVGPAGGGAPGGSFNYENARNDWMGGGYDVSNPDAARRSAAAWAAKHGIAYDGSDTVTLPNGGGAIDILGNFGGGQGNGQAIARNWTPAGGNGPNAGGAGGGGGFAGGGPGGSGGAGGGGDFQSQIRQLLLQQLQGMAKPVGADDPAIAGELQAQERGAERSRQERRAAMAERAAAQGLLQGGASSGAFDADVASGFEDKANRLSDVRSQLFGREIQSRRASLQNMLQMALATGDAEAARAIQLQMAQMDDATRRYSIGESSRQFNDQFGRQLGRDREEDMRWRTEFGF